MTDGATEVRWDPREGSGGELRRGSPVERATNASSSPRPVAARATSLRPAPVSRAEAAAVATRHRARDPVRARTARRAGPSGDVDVASGASARGGSAADLTTARRSGQGGRDRAATRMFRRRRGPLDGAAAGTAQRERQGGRDGAGWVGAGGAERRRGAGVARTGEGAGRRGVRRRPSRPSVRRYRRGVGSARWRGLRRPVESSAGRAQGRQQGGGDGEGGEGGVGGDGGARTAE